MEKELKHTIINIVGIFIGFDANKNEKKSIRDHTGTQALLHKAEERGAKLIKQRVVGADVRNGEVVALHLADTEEVITCLCLCLCLFLRMKRSEPSS